VRIPLGWLDGGVRAILAYDLLGLGSTCRRWAKGKPIDLCRLLGEHAAAKVQHLGQERQQAYVLVV
jgi:hypothetical protein